MSRPVAPPDARAMRWPAVGVNSAGITKIPNPRSAFEMRDESEVESLKAEIAYLKGLLDEQTLAALVESLRIRFSLRNLAVQVLAHLFAANGGVIAYSVLYDLYPDPERVALGNDLQMSISYIRGALGGKFNVECVPKQGYRLSRIGLNRVRETLSTVPHPNVRPFARRRTRKSGKLTDDQVRAIRAFKGSTRQCAAKFGISQRLVSYIQTRKQYAYVPDKPRAYKRKEALAG